MEETPAQTLSILGRAGILTNVRTGHATFTRADGTPGRVDRRAELVQTSPLSPDVELVAQISRWDRLKDPVGVMRAFAEHIVGQTTAHLLLAGPAAESVADDPDGAGVLAETMHAWNALPDEARQRVHLASLPMSDAEENAAIVNALQRRADVIVQKSLAEGFGLTVAEAMWKQRPVVASRIGGIQDQIVDGESGALIDDPRDLQRFATVVAGLLGDRDRARRMGVAARLRVRDHFLPPQHLARYVALIERLAT